MNGKIKFLDNGFSQNIVHSKLKLFPFSYYALVFFIIATVACETQQKKPNLIFVFADQWRAQDLGYMGNSEVRTPALDKDRKSVV